MATENTGTPQSQLNTNDLISNLNAISQKLDEKIDKLDSTLDSFSDNLGKLLNNASSDFDKSANTFREKTKQGNEDFSKDWRNAQREDRNLRQRQETSAAQAAAQSFKIVFDYANKRFEQAVKSVYRNYQDNLTEITTKMQYTTEQYTNELKTATKNIRSTDLTKAFTQIDFTKSLESTIDRGLRGDVATRTAFQNMITNKLMPSINTNSRNYIRLAKSYSNIEQLSKDMTGVTESITSYFGSAEGIDDNEFNSMIDSLGSVIKYANKGSDEGKTESFNTMSAIMTQMRQQGIESDEFVQAITDAANGTPGGNSVLQNQMGLYSPEATVKALSSAEGIEQLYQNYLNAYKNTLGGNADAAGVAASTLGYNMDNYYNIESADTNTSDNLAQIKDYISQSSYDAIQGTYSEYLSNLQNGEYTSISEQQTNVETNKLSEIGDNLGEAVPDLDGIANTTSQILTVLKTYLAGKITSDFLGGGGSESGLLKTLLGAEKTAALSTGVKTAGKTLLKNGTLGEAVVNGLEGAGVDTIGGSLVQVGGEALSGLVNVASGVAGLVTGGVMAAKDANAAVDRANANGMSTGKVLGASATGALTGSETAGMNDSEKLNYFKEHSSMWNKDTLKSIGSNALKGAAIGGGLGSLGGPLGTGAGAVVGGVVGATAGVVDYVAERHAYKGVIEASKKIKEEFEETSKAQSQYNSDVQKANQLQSEINTLQEKSTEGSKAEQAQNELLLAQKKIELQQLINKIKAENDLNGLTAKDYESAMDASTILSKAAQGDFDSLEDIDDAATQKQIKKAMEIDEDTSWNSAVKQIEKKYKKGKASVITEGANNAMTVASDASQYQSSQLSAAKMITWDDYNTWSDDQKDMNFSTVQEALYSYYYGKDGKTTLANAMELVGVPSDIQKDYLKYVSSHATHSAKWDEYKASTGYEGKRAFFRSGADTVSEGLAYLHSGEAVLTAGAASTLRGMASANGNHTLTDFINSLYAEDTTSKSKSANKSSATSTLETAITAQTKVMVTYLDSIVGYLDKMSGGTGNTKSKKNENLITWQGA